ncbi:MAG: ABC transporter permease subunit [Clostridiales bacterium]
MSKGNFEIYPKLTKIRFIQEFVKNKELFLMILPPSIFILINNYIPMFGIVIAFQNYNYEDRFFSPWIGFKNFEFLFKSDNAWIITRNTIGYNLVFIVLGLIIALSTAIVLNELRNRILAKFYQSVIFLPYFLSWVVVAYLVYSILSPDGLYNKSLIKIIHLAPIDWYTTPKFWTFIIPIVHIWKTIGYSIVIYLAGISGINQEYYEAAVLDGANKIQQTKSITIPFLIPLMIITTIMAVGNIFRTDFGLFYQIPMQQGLLKPTTDVLDTYIYNALITSGDFGMASAAGFYQSIVGFIFVLFANWVVGKVSKENKIF